MDQKVPPPKVGYETRLGRWAGLQLCEHTRGIGQGQKGDCGGESPNRVIDVFEFEGESNPGRSGEPDGMRERLYTTRPLPSSRQNGLLLKDIL